MNSNTDPIDPIALNFALQVVVMHKTVAACHTSQPRRSPRKKENRPSEDDEPKKKKGRSTNYSNQEIADLLEVVERHQPAGQKACEVVAREHGKKYPNREHVSLRMKYNNLVKAKPPTGEPEMSVLIAKAKKVSDDIYILELGELTWTIQMVP